jgi:acetyl-CoA carboxylase carboxyl transferase subunit alpha
MFYLDFEKPIKDLEEKLQSTKDLAEQGGNKVSNETVRELENKVEELKQDIYSGLSNWQKVQIARHPERPYTLDYLNNIASDFKELHGDRNVKDDKAIVGGFGTFDKQTVMFIGHQKGKNAKLRAYRNFGMPNPEGYRKANRLMKLAEKFGKPVVTFIDTPGAAPGVEAERRGQAEAIARNLKDMAMLRVPVICVIIGEGASGGALGIGIGDQVFMLEYTWYSVIAPESCSSILWRSRDHKEQAAEELQLTADKLQENKLIDGIVREPLGGAHNDPEQMYYNLSTYLSKTLDELRQVPTDDLIEQRMEKFANMGAFHEE